MGLWKNNSAPSGGEDKRKKNKTEEFEQAKQQALDNFNRLADEYIMTHPHGSPHYTPNPYPGVTCEGRPDENGRYHYTRKPNNRH